MKNSRCCHDLQIADLNLHLWDVVQQQVGATSEQTVSADVFVFLTKYFCIFDHFEIYSEHI